MTTNSPEKVVLRKSSPAEALVKAELDSGVHVAVSPNMVLVPEVSISESETKQARMDGMFFWAEFTKWPSFFTIGFEHIACVPMRPEWRDSQNFMPWKSNIMLKYNPEAENVLWRDLQAEDYTSKDELDLEMGTIAASIIRELQMTMNHVLYLAELTSSKIFGEEQKLDIDDPRTWKNAEQALAFHLCSRVNTILWKLKNYRDRRMDLLFTFRDLQRAILELIGWVAYNAEIRQTMLNGPDERPVHPYPVSGAFVCDVGSLAQLHNAGIPVWLVCGTARLPEAASVAKEVKMRRLEEFFAKDGWKEEVYYFEVTITVPVERHFCRTKEMREREPNGTGLRMRGIMKEEALSGESRDKQRDTEAPLQLAEFHRQTISRRLGTNGFFSSTEPIPASPNTAAITRTVSSSGTMTIFQYEPIPRTKRTLGKLYTSTQYPIEIVPEWANVMEWLKGLSTSITATPKHRAERLLPPAIAMTRETSGRIFSAWLAFRLAWMSQLRKRKAEGFSSEGWKTLLRLRAMKDVAEAPEPTSKNEKRQEGRHERLEKGRDTLRAMGIGERWKEEDQARWNGAVITEKRFNDLFKENNPIIKEVAYEITELNFRYDILSLDNYEMREMYSSTAGFAEHRQSSFLKIFHNEVFVDRDGIRTPDIWSLSPKERIQYTGKLAAFMRAWPSWPDQYRTPMEVVPEEELAKAEEIIFKHYIFAFLHTFNRFPFLPCVRPASVRVWYEGYLEGMEIEAAQSAST